MPLTSSLEPSRSDVRTMMRSTTRIGVDVNDVNDVSLSMAAFGERYLLRVFNEEEASYSRAHPRTRDSYLAGRFAAREAVVKLLDLNDAASPWLVASIHGDSVVTVELKGAAKDAAEERGIGEIFVSIDHTDSCAVAVAVADIAQSSSGEPR